MASVAFVRVMSLGVLLASAAGCGAAGGAHGRGSRASSDSKSTTAVDGKSTAPIIVAKRAPFELIATSGDGGLWAYRRGTAGPLTLVRSHDWSVVASLPDVGAIAGSGFDGLAKYEGARFCIGGGFAVLVSQASPDRNVHAWYWDGTARAFEPFAPGTTFSNDAPKVGVNRYQALGWSETCELIAFGPAEVRGRPGVSEIASTAEATQVLLRLFGRTSSQNFDFVAITSRPSAPSILDVTPEAVLFADGSVDGGYRLGLIDRKTRRSSNIARMLYPGSAWVRRDRRRFVVIPGRGEAPRILETGGHPDVATTTAFAPHAAPKVEDDGFSHDVVATVDASGDVLATLDSTRIEWWSLRSGRRLRSQEIEGFDLFPLNAYVDLFFSPDGRLTVLHNPNGNVVATRREGGTAYRYAFAMSTCGSPEPCATGNKAALTKSVRSLDATRIATGTSSDWAHGAKNSQTKLRPTTVIDVATGDLHELPTFGEPLAFVDGHEKLVIEEDVWSIAERRVVGHLPE